MKNPIKNYRDNKKEQHILKRFTLKRSYDGEDE